MKTMRIVLAGGGSGGSAAPVIAVAEALRARDADAEFLYVGTRTGPERALVGAAGLDYRGVASGRLRRYWTWRNAIDPWLAGAGVVQAAALVRSFAPDVGFGAGGFGAVPPLLAARMLGVPIVIHQQDAIPGLANRLLAPFASAVTVAFEDTARRFRTPGSQVVGNPVRRAVSQAEDSEARRKWAPEPEVPLVLAMGGGTGALGLNRLVFQAARELIESCLIVHLTGQGKGFDGWTHPRYRQLEFLTHELPGLLAAADLVVCRAGMSTLAELATLKKAAIVVPMPSSHQEANAAAFALRDAAVVRSEPELTVGSLAADIRALLNDPNRRRRLGTAAAQVLPSGAADAIAARIVAVARRQADD